MDKMELTQRKRNRLKCYDYSKPGAYFVTVCTKDRREILSTVVGDGVLDVPKTVLTDYGTVAEKYIINIDVLYNSISIPEYVIMPNHIHMIIIVNDSGGMSGTPSPTNATIPFIVSTLKRLCAKEIGQDIFQRSYHDHIIRNRESYQKIRKYIRDNPKTWEYDCFYTPQI